MMAWLAQPFLKEIGINMKNYGIIWALLLLLWYCCFFTHKIEKLTELKSLFIVGVVCVLGYIFITNNMNYVGLLFFIFYANGGYATPLLRNYINRNTNQSRTAIMSIRSFIIVKFYNYCTIYWLNGNQYGLNSAFLTMASTVCILAIPCLFFFNKKLQK